MSHEAQTTSRLRSRIAQVARCLPFLLLVYGPLLALLPSVGALSAAEAAELLLPAGRRGHLLLHSVLLAAGTSLVSSALGLVAASALWRSPRASTQALKWLLVLLIPMPPFLHAYGWYPAFAALRSVWRSAAIDWLASGWVHAMAFLPVAVLLAWLSFDSVETPLVEAALVHRRPWTVFRNVVVPLCRAPLAASAGLLFVFALVEYTIPSLYSVSTYSLEIFSEFSATGDPGRACLLSMPILAIVVGTLLATQAPLRTIALCPPSATVTLHKLLLPAWFRIVQAGALTVLLVQALVLAVPLARGLFDPSLVWRTWSAVGGEAVRTFSTALAASLCGIVVAVPVVRTMIRGGVVARACWLAVLVPLGLPASLAGVGLVAFWGQPIGDAVYGTGWMLLFAYLSRFLPIVALVLAGFARRLDPLLLEAGRLYQTNVLRRYVRIDAPLLAPGLMAAGGLMFAFSVGEVATCVLVAPPGSPTLSVRVYNYLHYGAHDVVGALSLLVALVVATTTYLAFHLARRPGGQA